MASVCFGSGQYRQGDRWILAARLCHGVNDFSIDVEFGNAGADGVFCRFDTDVGDAGGIFEVSDFLG